MSYRGVRPLKEDILEQLVEEYLQHRGYFTRHNDKFRPDQQHADYVTASDAVHSDIDILAIDPQRRGADRVWVVTCKSWQGGFNPEWWMNAFDTRKTAAQKRAWKRFREITSEKWAEAFCRRVAYLSGSRSFTYVVAVTKLNGDRASWEANPNFRRMLRGNKIRVLTVDEMLRDVLPRVGTTMASTEIGRLLQVVKASGFRLGYEGRAPESLLPRAGAREARRAGEVSGSQRPPPGPLEARRPRPPAPRRGEGAAEAGDAGTLTRRRRPQPTGHPHTQGATRRVGTTP